jgi:hypothetical protein
MIPIENVLVLNIDVLNGHHDYAVTYPVKKIVSVLFFPPIDYSLQ